MTGQDSMWSFSKAPTVEISSNVINKIKQMNISYNKGTKR